MPGFPYRQDGYEYMLNVEYILDSATKGILPYGEVWFNLANCGFSKVILPFLNSLQLIFFIATNKLLFSYNISMFFLYFISSLTMYFLAYVLNLGRFGRLTASITFTFSQFMLFEMLLGHLSMAFASALIPLVIALVIKNSRNSSWITQTLLSLVLSLLIIERADFAYYTIAFLLILVPIITKTPRLKNLLSLSIPVFSAVLITFPLIELTYLSNSNKLTDVWGVYNFAHYTPNPLQLITPVFTNVEAYLGLSVVVLSLVGGLPTFFRFIKNKNFGRRSDMLCVLFLLIGLLFIIIGLGNNTPLYGFLNNYAPLFSGFRVPTRWLIVTQLCFGVLAGKAVMSLTGKISNLNYSKTKLKYFKSIISFLIMVIIFIDLSTFVSTNVTGWSPIIGTNSDSSVYFSPQASQVPNKSQAYEYITSDAGTYRIFVTPTIYSTSYWEYLQHLKNTNITLASGYALAPALSQIQEKLESELRYGNFTTELGEELALLSVKYVVYDYSKDRWDGLIEKLSNSDDLKFLFDDGRYVLFLNLRFGDVPKKTNLLDDPSFQINGWTPWERLNGSTGVDSNTFLSGNSSVKCTVNKFDDLAGSTFYYYPNGTESEFTLSGWSAAVNLTGEDVLYSLRASAIYEDESQNNYAFFNSGTHNWEYSSVTFSIDPTKHLKRLEISFSIRNGVGTVWFDDLFLSTNSFSNDWKGFYCFKNYYSNVKTLFSERNVCDLKGSFWKISPQEFHIEVYAEEPCYILLSETYDDGWIIVGENYAGKVQISEYKGLLAINVTESCFVDLNLVFISHSHSLNRIGTFFILGLILLIFPLIFSLISRVICSKKDTKTVSILD